MGNKMRTLLTISGISVGISTIVFLVSLGYGLQELSIKRITNISSLTSLDVVPAQNTVIINSQSINNLQKIPNVTSVSPLFSLAGQISSGNKKTDVAASAINSDYIGLQGINTSVGGIFSDNEKKIIVSSAIAKLIDKTPDQLVGKDCTFYAYFPKNDGDGYITKELKYNIVGIIDDNNSSYIYLPLNSIKDMLNEKTVYNSVKIKVNNRTNLTQVKSQIEGKGFKATSIADTIDQVYKFFSYVQIILASFGIIALVVASIGMFNTMTIALLERTRDIGIMKAVGIQNSVVKKMFITESFLISFIGGVFGVIIGICIGKVSNIIINALAVSVGGEPQKLFSTPLFVILVILFFSVLVGLATGIYPARRASRLNPLDALRYE